MQAIFILLKNSQILTFNTVSEQNTQSYHLGKIQVQTTVIQRQCMEYNSSWSMIAQQGCSFIHMFTFIEPNNSFLKGENVFTNSLGFFTFIHMFKTLSSFYQLPISKITTIFACIYYDSTSLLESKIIISYTLVHRE
jgi:hypothetical protein